ncbi:MAG: right-handed parallel beta-helix repeat-containing protein [Deltaproteobacteria bacterium]|nr:right-handed parallel beta-helix repeat-containing protein [Deltaproteobacteria bacterium]
MRSRAIQGCCAVLLGALLAQLDARAAAATVWNVPGDGSNVCTSGNPNCNTIQQAVTAAVAGDSIAIGAGTFSGAGNQTIVVNKMLTISGAGRTNTVVAPSGTYAFSIRANDVTISDLTLQGGTVGVLFSNASTDNALLRRIDFSGNTTRGIDFSLSAAFAATDVTIDDCAFATPNIGIRMASTAHVNGLAISASSFTGNIYGMYVANDGNSSELRNLTISTTTFSNNSAYAIYAEEMRESVIEDSTFTNNKVGIGLLKFYAAALAMGDVTIRRNTFTQTAGSAIDFEVYSSALFDDVTIADNTIGLDVAALTSNASAIFVMLTHTQTHAPVHLTGNTITLSGSFGAATAAYAVRLRRNGPVTLTGNVLDGGGVGGSGNTPATSGLYVEAVASSGTMPATTTISGSCNRITGFRNGVSVFDSLAGAYGGLVAGATVDLDGNDLSGNSDYGLINGVAAQTVGAQNVWWGCAAGPGNPGCDAIAGAVDASGPAAASDACTACSNAAQCDDANPCTVDACSDTCSHAAGNAGAPCRAAAGACDLAESCDGASPSCPADLKSSAACRPAVDVCDAAESCDGVGNDCPADAKNSGVCRASAGACDLAESCDGVADACPADVLVAANTVCRAAAGVCDLAETCDGAAPNCPTDAKSSAVCRASAGACDVAESCDGSGDVCPNDTLQPDGTACGDGAFCNGAEQCQAGVCQSGTPPCALSCDEGSDTCTLCPAAPQSCRAALKSVLVVRDKTDDTRDKLVWRWNKGEATTVAEFGDPTDTTDYALCFYDAGTLVGSALVPAGAPNWQTAGTKGYKFKDAGGTPNGIGKATLKSGAADKAKAKLGGKGANLPNLPLPFSGPVSVQLVNGTSGLCFGADYQGAELLKNETGMLKAKSQ